MSDYYVCRIDEQTKLTHSDGKTHLVYEGKDWNGNPESNEIEITNIGMTILALQDMVSSTAKKW